MENQRIAVIGAGQMGSGIAQVAAEAGYRVILHDIAPDFVRNGMSRIDKALSKATKKIDKAVDKGDYDKIVKAIEQGGDKVEKAVES